MIKQEYFSMKKILGNSRLISIAILNIILMIVTLAFFKPAYETNDDFMMGLISSGAYGDSYQ